jgi:hypothetical protein
MTSEPACKLISHLQPNVLRSPLNLCDTIERWRRSRDEWVTQMLRQGDAQVFKKYSQMKLQMKREALEKMNRQASEMPAQGTPGLCTAMLQ